MDALVREQLNMFELIMERPLTDDEKYLIRNSFQDGFGAGREDAKNNIVYMIKEKI